MGRKSGGESVLRDNVKAKGMSWQQFEDTVRASIFRETVIYQFVTRDLIVGPQEIQEYYRRHEKDFTTPMRVQFRQILFRVAKPEERRAARERAMAALTAARAGRPFASLAEKESDDARDGRPYLWDAGRGILQAKDGAKIETEGRTILSAQEVDRALREKIESTPIGALTDPVETDSGFVLVCVEARFPAEKIPLDQVQGQIEAMLMMEKRQTRYRELIDRLWRQAYVHIVR